MHLLLKVVTHGPDQPRTRSTRFTEVADECRHSTMFGPGHREVRAGPYPAPWWFPHLLKPDPAGAHRPGDLRRHAAG